MERISLTHLENNNDNYLQLISYFELLDSSFVPSLSSYVDIKDYAKKLIKNAYVVILNKDNTFIGLYAIYVNNIDEKIAYFSSLAVLDEYKGKGYSSLLMEDAIRTAKNNNMQIIRLEVIAKYARAINFHIKNGFIKSSEPSKNPTTIYMHKKLKDE